MTVPVLLRPSCLVVLMYLHWYSFYFLFQVPPLRKWKGEWLNLLTTCCSSASKHCVVQMCIDVTGMEYHVSNKENSNMVLLHSNNAHIQPVSSTSTNMAASMTTSRPAQERSRLFRRRSPVSDFILRQQLALSGTFTLSLLLYLSLIHSLVHVGTCE